MAISPLNINIACSHIQFKLTLAVKDDQLQEVMVEYFCLNDKKGILCNSQASTLANATLALTWADSAFEFFTPRGSRFV